MKFSDEENYHDTDTSFAATSSLLSRLSQRSSFIGGKHKFNVNIQLLDDSKTLNALFKKSNTGQDVLDYICHYLDIVEKEYFGLRYQDSNKHRYWLDLSKPLSKQFKFDHVSLRFRVRFYPENPDKLREEITRYQIFVQLQRDLLLGRLHCSQVEASLLAALILQSVIGDYNEEAMGTDSDYVSQYKLLLRQSHKVEEKIAISHQTFKGLTAAEAELEFLRIASKIETYGFDPYVIKDPKQIHEIILGGTCHGVLVFYKNQKLHKIKWKDIEKIDYIGKQLKIVPKREYFAEYFSRNSLEEWKAPQHNFNLLNSSFIEESNKKMSLKFLCPSADYSKHLWRQLLSQQAFFTEEKAVMVKPKFSKARIPLFSRGSTFRCPTVKVLSELEKDSTPPRPPQLFERYSLAKQAPRSMDEPWNNTSRVSKKSSNNTLTNAMEATCGSTTTTFAAPNSTTNFLDENETPTRNFATFNEQQDNTSVLFNEKSTISDNNNSKYDNMKSDVLAGDYSKQLDELDKTVEFFAKNRLNFGLNEADEEINDEKDTSFEKHRKRMDENWNLNNGNLIGNGHRNERVRLFSKSSQEGTEIAPKIAPHQQQQSNGKKLTDGSIPMIPLFAGMGLFIGVFVLIAALISRYNLIWHLAPNN